MEFYWLLVLHMVGDYLLQSDWMAQKKTTSSVPAAAHALVYTAPFWLLMPSWTSMLIIGGTHFVIDRWRLARYVCWAKNLIAPRESAHFERHPLEPATSKWPDKRVVDATWHHPWSDCIDTGYHKDRPPWLAVWLLIIADNTLHLGFNGLALVLFTTGT